MKPSPISLLRMSDGTDLQSYHCPAKPGLHAKQGIQPQASILLVHGFNDHAMRYQREITELARWGYDVWAYDARGHGASGGVRGGLPHDDSLVDDLAQVFKHLSALTKTTPIVVAHSMGGLTALLATLESKMTPRALVLTSPCLGVPVNWWQKLQLNIGLRLFPDKVMPQKTVDRARTARDPEVVKRTQADPLLLRGVSARMGAYLIQGGARVRNLLENWNSATRPLPMPTLMMVALGDLIVRPEASLDFATQLQNTPATRGNFSLKTYPEHYHELFNELEPERRIVMQDLRDWLASV